MGIARALKRVKRQAKRGGLGALRSGLGEELRSGAIPGPLRGAARRIAAIIDPGSKRSTYQPGSTATPIVDRAPTETLRHAPPAQANKVGSDRGDAPVQPEAPSDTDEVDPISVGATPVYDATPAVVAPIDATPSDVASADVTPVVVSAPLVIESEPVEPKPAAEKPAKPEAKPAAQPKAQSKAQPKKPANGKAKPSTPPAAAKEKLAPSEEAAKSVARSGTKAKRSGGSGGKTSKKK
ncbi:MAG: hypothetical protein ABW352_19345 [Polyangiales bacterium]